MNFNKICILFGFLLFNLTLFSQTDLANIEIVSFSSSAIYAPGSSVSVHINPTGIYKLDDPLTLGTDDAVNNKFVLELSDSSGGFTNAVVLAEVYGFYTPLINGIIPSNTLPSSSSPGSYKLRIVATLGLDDFEAQTYSQQISETESFTVTSGLISDYQEIVSGITSINNNFFNCYNENEGYSIERNDINPTLGSVNRGLGALTNDTGVAPGVTNINFEYNPDNSYAAYLFDISNSGSENQILNIVNLFGVGSIDLPIDNTNPGNPEGLPIGTYNIQIEEITPEGISSIYSVTFLWHSNNTNLGNTTAETICLNSNVIFAIDNSLNGIARNYPDSYYVFEFGDGSDVQFFTHAELMFEDTIISHIYSLVSCESGDGAEGSNFIISKELFNNFRTNSDDDCGFLVNGLGTEKAVNVSEAPVASFTLDDKQCENQPISAFNSSALGQWGLNGSCLDDAVFNWYVKGPSQSSFINVNSIPLLSSWVVGDDLVIPVDVVSAGCWEIYLTAYNEDLCQTVSQAPTQTISIEAIPTADFDILLNGQVVTEICVNSTVILDDTSNVSSLECQDPTYLWTIEPTTGFNFENDTTENSQNPEITFTVAGIYTITQTITNLCGTASVFKDLLVEGAPSVVITTSSDQICLGSSAIPYIVDFSTTYIPAYSDIPYAPSSYSWSIVGADVSASDYSFISGTDSGSPFPIIQFNSFIGYTISITVDGDCEDSSSDELILILNEIPEITNTEFTQSICSGENTTEVVLTSTMPSETSFSWTAVADDFISGFTTSGSGNIPSELIINSSNQSGAIIYTVVILTPDCEGVAIDFEVVVNPTPQIADKSEVICSEEAFTLSPTNENGDIVPISTTYTWSEPISNPLNAISGGSAAANQSLISQTLTLNNDTTEPATLTYTIIPESMGCTGDSFELSVVVNPIAQVNFTANEVVCNLEATTVLFTTENTDGVTAYAWTSDIEIGAGLTGAGDLNFTAANLGTEPLVATVIATPTFTNDGVSCDGPTETFTITVNPSAQVDTPDDVVVCNADTTETIVFTTQNTDGITT